jgi:hypothetical protein
MQNRKGAKTQGRRKDHILFAPSLRPLRLLCLNLQINQWIFDVKVRKDESALAPKQLLKHVLAKKLPHPFDLFEFEQNVRNAACRYIQNIRSGDKTKGDFHFHY